MAAVMRWLVPDQALRWKIHVSSSYAHLFPEPTLHARLSGGLDKGFRMAYRIPAVGVLEP